MLLDIELWPCIHGSFVREKLITVKDKRPPIFDIRLRHSVVPFFKGMLRKMVFCAERSKQSICHPLVDVCHYRVLPDKS